MPDPLIAVLARSILEVDRWKTATYAGDDIFHVNAVVTEQDLAELRFRAVFCLPHWQSGYGDAARVLRWVEARLINRPLRVPVSPSLPLDSIEDLSVPMPPIPIPPPLTMVETAEILGANIADTWSANQVLDSRGISHELMRVVPADCVGALVAMIRLANSHPASNHGYSDFIGFTLQMFAFRFSRNLPVAQQGVAFPEVPSVIPPDIFGLYPQRLVDEELRSFGVSDGARGAMNGHMQRQFTMRVYRLHYMELNNVHLELRAAIRDQLLRELYTIGVAYGSLPRIRMPVDPPPPPDVPPVPEATAWFLPDPVPPLVDRSRPRDVYREPPPSYDPTTQPYDEPNRHVERAVPPPVNYIPGQASEQLRRRMDEIERLERERNELLRRRGPRFPPTGRGF